MSQLETIPKVCRRGDKETIVRLIELLGNESEDVRNAAVDALVMETYIHKLRTL